MFYQIKIEGHLQSHWFEALEIAHLEDNTTLISGEFEDQASLFGTLRRIRDLGIALVSINPAPPESPTPQATSTPPHKTK